ncbi:MAG: HEPN domain-containing protein [Spirochaetales bacterium]
MIVDPVAEWLALAHQDLSSAQFLLGMRPSPVEVICFHCQQAAEKLLKAVLAKATASIPKTHDLLVLLDLVCEVDPKFKILEAPLTDLNDFSVVVRYPAHVMLEEMDATKALADAESVKTVVLALVKA